MGCSKNPDVIKKLQDASNKLKSIQPDDTQVKKKWCQNCKTILHNTIECPNKKSNTINQVKCFKCGKLGHYATDCTTAINHNEKMLNDRCFRCKRSGHYAVDCYVVTDINGEKL